MFESVSPPPFIAWIGRFLRETNMGTLGTDVGMAVAIFPPKLGPVGARRGSADPRVPPLAPPFILDTARWAPILCTSVPGLCTSVFSVKWTLLLSVTQDAIFCGFLLRILCVFILFPTCVPAINNSPTLVKFISDNSYHYC